MEELGIIEITNLLWLSEEIILLRSKQMFLDEK